MVRALVMHYSRRLHAVQQFVEYVQRQSMFAVLEILCVVAGVVAICAMPIAAMSFVHTILAGIV